MCPLCSKNTIPKSITLYSFLELNGRYQKQCHTRTFPHEMAAVLALLTKIKIEANGVALSVWLSYYLPRDSSSCSLFCKPSEEELPSSKPHVVSFWQWLVWIHLTSAQCCSLGSSWKFLACTSEWPETDTSLFQSVRGHVAAELTSENMPEAGIPPLEADVCGSRSIRTNNTE